MTPEAQQRAQALQAERKAAGGQYDACEHAARVACIIMGWAGPPMRDAGYNSNYDVVQGPAGMILTEMIPTRASSRWMVDRRRPPR